MCDINGPFKLCTCESNVDRSKPHWVLHRNLQSKEEHQLMGEFNLPDPYSLISERSLQRRLNSINVFDFDYEPKEGDLLELFLNPEIEYDEEGEAYDDELYPEFSLEFRKARWQLLEPFEMYVFKHKNKKSGEIKGPKSELALVYEKFIANASEKQLVEFQFAYSIKPTKKRLLAYFKSIISSVLIATFLFACDLQPIDYSKKTRKSSFTRSSVTQTGRLRKAHARKGVSTSKRAFKNRINSRGYYYRNKNRRKLRKGD